MRSIWSRSLMLESTIHAHDWHDSGTNQTQRSRWFGIPKRCSVWSLWCKIWIDLQNKGQCHSDDIVNQTFPKQNLELKSVPNFRMGSDLSFFGRTIDILLMISVYFGTFWIISAQSDGFSDSFNGRFYWRIERLEPPILYLCGFWHYLIILTQIRAHFDAL